MHVTQCQSMDVPYDIDFPCKIPSISRFNIFIRLVLTALCAQSTVQPELHLDDTAGSTCDIERGTQWWFQGRTICVFAVFVFWCFLLVYCLLALTDGLTVWFCEEWPREQIGQNVISSDVSLQAIEGASRVPVLQATMKLPSLVFQVLPHLPFGRFLWRWSTDQAWLKCFSRDGIDMYWPDRPQEFPEVPEAMNSKMF